MLYKQGTVFLEKSCATGFKRGILRIRGLDWVIEDFTSPENRRYTVVFLAAKNNCV